MNQDTITQYINDTFADIHTHITPDSTFFFYDHDRKFTFATIVTKDDEYDQLSNLNRPDVFRLNMGISKQTFLSLFDKIYAQSEASKGLDSKYDFTALDKLMPHPVYGRMYWVCILNPSPATFEEVVKPLLAEAYAQDVKQYAKRRAKK